MLAACSRELTIKIGVAVPLTGALSQMAKDCVNGAQIAVDELNEDHVTVNGRRAHFELIVEDDKGLPEGGRLAAQRLIDEKVNAVFGDLNSGVTIPASVVYAKAGIPQISVSTNPKYTRQGLKTAFRITADDVMQGAEIGILVSEKLHAKSIYMIDDQTAFGVGLAEEVSKVIKEKNIKAQHESIDGKNADLQVLVQRIIDNKVDVVFFGGDATLGLPLLKELRKSRNAIKFVTADTLCDESSIQSAQGAADGNFYCTVATIPSSWLSGGIHFFNLYKEKYGNPGNYSTLAYDSVHILSQAMQAANSSDPEVYLPVLAKGSFDGKVQGAVEFDEKGDIKDGTVVVYQSISGKLIEQRNLM